MQTFERKCLKDFEFRDSVNNCVKLEKGKKYLTSVIDEDGEVTVFTTFWIDVPSDLFDKGIEFTKSSKLEKKQDGPKKIIFTSDECQCLLDVFDRIVRDNLSEWDGKTIDMFLITKEERTSYEKLVEAGKFYVPINNFVCKKYRRKINEI